MEVGRGGVGRGKIKKKIIKKTNNKKAYLNFFHDVRIKTSTT